MRKFKQCVTGTHGEYSEIYEIIKTHKFGVVNTPRIFIVAKLSIRKLGSSSVLIGFTMKKST